MMSITFNEYGMQETHNTEVGEREKITINQESFHESAGQSRRLGQRKNKTRDITI
jgi:hypothetical protein